MSLSALLNEIDYFLDLDRDVWGYEFNQTINLTEHMRNDDLLHTEKILADRKTFYLDLKENQRGKVIKITEEVSGNRDTIMVPAEILGDFIEALTDIRVTAEE